MTCSKARLRGVVRSTLAWCVLGILAVGSSGCRTQEDAAAAATQMATTSQTLSAYYGSLDEVLGETQDVYQAQNALQGVPAMDLSETRKQIRLRADMATQIAEVAALFQQISRSKAASDSSVAAGKLSAQLVSMKALSSNSAATTAVTKGIEEIVLLIQQHDEIKAAKKVGPLCHDLSLFFVSEEPEYDSLNQAYLVSARSVAQKLVSTNQVDTSSVFLSALRPFGMTPAISLDQSKSGMQVYLLAQIDAAYKVKLDAADEASAALSAALKEMDARMELVAHDKTMSFRAPPVSLKTAQDWISQATR